MIQIEKTRNLKAVAAILVAGLLILADPRVVSFGIGVIIVCAGLVIRLWSYGYIEKNRALAMHGPYAHTRNPAYFGSFVAMIGLFIAAGNPDSARGIASWFIGVVGICIFLGWYMPAKYAREYPRLRASFPNEFAEHAATTPDFFPRLSVSRRTNEQRFSWRKLKKSRELKRPLIVALALALMWII